MAYRHGVYTNEVSTSIQTAAPVDSALPFVIGGAPKAVGPVLVTSWSRYCALFGVDEKVDINSGAYSNGGCLTNFAHYWFVLAGRSDCIMQSLPQMQYCSPLFKAVSGTASIDAGFKVSLGSVAVDDLAAVYALLNGSRVKVSLASSKYSAVIIDSDGVEHATTQTSDAAIAPFTVTVGASTVTFTLYDGYTASVANAEFPSGITEVSVSLNMYGDTVKSGADIIAAIQGIHTLYERFNRVASLLTIPGRFGDVKLYSGLVQAMAAAVSNIGGRFKGVALVDLPNGFSGNGDGVSYDDVHDEKESSSPFVIYSWPYVGVGEFRFNASTALCAAINATDGQYGGLPYVSPSNKPLPITGAYYKYENDDDVIVEDPVFLTRDDVNAHLGAYGITGFRNTAQGWVAWGDNTAAFPGSTDVKDYMIPIRRMFNYVSNQFQVFADARVDMPLNLRQLEGVVKSFNQILAGWIGFGALNAGSVELDKELNTTASLLAGTVYVRIRIAPPPAMVVIEGVLEYDVQGFERSLA